MSAEIHPFPTALAAPLARRRRAEVNALRYVARAEETFRLMSNARSELQKTALCEIAEAWLELAEVTLPARRTPRPTFD